ncbi:MAG: peptidyl-prolyl cis-trans isomerase [Acidobacteriota bacterium]
MTMLDRMRRHRNWLKWILAVVVLTFVLVYVPQFLEKGAGNGPGDVVATVNGRPIAANVYQRVYTQQISQLKSNYGQVSDDMIKQLGLGPRLLQQLVNQEAELAEADRLKLTVSDGELRERLLRLPAFTQNGQFVGYAQYRQMLAASRPPIREDEFEADLRKSLLAEKLQAALTGWIRVSDADVEQEYRRRNEKIKMDLAVFSGNQFRAGIQPTEADLNAEFTAHADNYKIPEKRQVKYLSIDAAALRAKMTATPQEVETRYRDNIKTYTTPEQVRASHILFKTEGKDDATVKKLAESVLAKVKAGGNFAALARQYSDDGSKDSGGDLDYFAKGTMVPEFDEAVWKMQPGQISDLVKSQFGYHIIMMTGRRPGTTRTLDEVRTQLLEQIRDEKAQAEAARIADEVAKEVKAPADIERVAKARGLTSGDSGLFSREEPLAGLGFAPAVQAEAFTLEKDKVSGMLRTNQGFAFIALVDIKPPYVPKLDEVKDRVRDAVITAKAVDVAKARAAAMAQNKGNFEAAAKAAGGVVKTTEFVARGTALPDIGVSDLVDSAAFALKAGETSAPIATDASVVVVHVRERQEITPAALETERETLREQLAQQRRQEFFGAYMTKAIAKMQIRYNEATVKTLLGS